MALAILTSPANGVSVNNEMLFVLQETVKTADEVTYPNYKFVLDIYVDSVLVARMKATPRPTTLLGIFDVGPILRAYTNYSFKANFANSTEVNSPYMNYRVKAGEEYNDTLYTNIIVDGSDRDAVQSYAVRPFTNSDVLGDAIFASNQPSTIYTYKEVKWHLLNFYEDSWPAGTENVDLLFYNEAGTLIDTRGYAGRTVTAKSFLQINVGWDKIQAEFPTSPELYEAANYFTVTVNSVVKTVRLLCTKYTPVVLAWLNPFGAYESQAFGLVSKKEIEIEGKSFARLPYDIDASGNVSYKSDGVFYGGKRKFSANTKTKMKLTSHLMNADEYTWIADMFKSTDVFIYDSTTDAFFPVTITDNNYEYRTYLNSKLKPLEFTVEFSDNYNSQHL